MSETLTATVVARGRDQREARSRLLRAFAEIDPAVRWKGKSFDGDDDETDASWEYCVIAGTPHAELGAALGDPREEDLRLSFDAGYAAALASVNVAVEALQDREEALRLAVGALEPLAAMAEFAERCYGSNRGGEFYRLDDHALTVQDTQQATQALAAIRQALRGGGPGT